MATKIIPAKTETTCDACGVACHNGSGKGGRRNNGRLTVRRDALDAAGCPVANANCDFDFCDECLCAVTDAVNRTVEAIRKKCLTPPRWGQGGTK